MLNVEILDAVGCIATCAQLDKPPWERTLQMATHRLISFPCLADRVAVIERLGSVWLGPVQYVDDLTTPCPSIGALRAILLRDGRSASDMYASTVKAEFNYGRGKTGVLPLFVAPPPDHDDVGCDVSTTRKILGILFDSNLTFAPMLRAVVGAAWGSFLELYFACESAGIAVPLMALQVALRVEPLVFFGAAFLVCADGAVGELNRLQYRWARRLLGVTGGAHTSWDRARLQCGWSMRLGTKLKENAIVALARLQLSPVSHPASRMLDAVIAHCVPSWYSVVCGLMASGDASSRIPEIAACGLFSPSALANARTSAHARRDCLRKYRQQIVKPALLALDWAASASSLGRQLAGLGMGFSEFLPASMELRVDACSLDWGVHSAQGWRSWAVVRITGTWPLCVFGGDGLPFAIPQCSGCGACSVGVVHALCVCPGTLVHFHWLRQHVVVPDRLEVPQFLKSLFSGELPTASVVFIIRQGPLRGVSLTK